MDWRTGDAAPTQSTAFRDAQHAVEHARTPRERIAAMNAGAKAFWDRGEPPTVTADMLRRAPPNSIADLNAYNRAFWAARS